MDISRRGEQILCRRALGWTNRKTEIALDLLDQCLGGADDDKNLCPEPRRSIEKKFPAELKHAPNTGYVIG